MLSSLLFYKLILVIIVVLGLSLLAEYAGTKLTGFLSAYPSGTALTQFFYGLEQSADFAAASALYSLAGLFAMQACFFGYYHAAKAVPRFSLAAGIIGATLAYAAAIMPLYILQPTPLLSLVIGAASILLFICLFSADALHAPPRRIRPGWLAILARTVIAASIFLFTTSIAGFVGPAWAGLFAAFPVVAFPLVLIVHASHGTTPALSLITQIPRGLGAILAYSGAVFLFYPSYGVYWGTLLAFGAATGYVVIYRLLPDFSLCSRSA
jgi:hypothetical protein